MSFARDYAKKRSERDDEFKQLWEDEGRNQMQEVAAKLIDLRLRLGLNQTEFARLVGVKQPFLSRLENGEQNVTYRNLQEIFRKAGARLTLEVEYEDKLVKS